VGGSAADAAAAAAAEVVTEWGAVEYRWVLGPGC